MIPVNVILLSSFLTIFTSCNGQVNIKTPKDNITSKPGPLVARNFTHSGMYPNFDTTLVGQYILSIFQDSKENLWFGTGRQSVVRYDIKSLTYYDSLDGFSCNRVHSIIEDKQGNIWFGTDQGVFKYDGKNFKNYKVESGLSNTWVGRKSMLIDKSGNIWLGTEGGVFRYNPSADTIDGKPFSLSPLLAFIKVKGILEDKMGNIWFASQDSGVYRFDGKTIINIAEKEDLGDNYAGGMLQDKTGNFWFTMKGGICRYDGKNLQTSRQTMD